MRPIACLYCEGTDAKLAVLLKEKDSIKILRTGSLTMAHSLSSSNTQSRTNALAEIEHHAMGGGEEDLSFESLDSSGEASYSGMSDSTDVGLLQGMLHDLKIGKMDYIPIVTEPVVNYHVYEGPRDSNKKKLINTIIGDLQTTKAISVNSDMMDVLELNDKSMLGVFLEGEIPCVGLVDQLANYNKTRFLKIPTIKVAELSLAHYVSKTNKFFPEDYSLIVYIGREYSKLIFLEGQKLKHIGSTLDIGTKNLHTYDVYFSKILLEMENGGIPKLDNIIICGEDRSENLILSFFGTFPEANVTELKFENFDTSLLTEEDSKNLALFAIPISVGIDYLDEISKQHTGVNFLPKYIQEKQKTFQFGWHGYLLMLLVFAAAFFFTFNILSNIRQIKDLDYEIERLQQRQLENQALVNQITPLDAKINSFDATQAILDSACAGNGIWNKNFSRLSDFIERRRSFWITKLGPKSKREINLSGFSLTRSVLTEFAQFNNATILKNINYEPLREKSAFSFNLNFTMMEDSDKAK